MKVRQVKRFIGVSLALAVLFTATGCGKKQEVDPNADPLLYEPVESLVSTIRSQENEIFGYLDEIEKLTEQNKAIQSERKQTAGIRELNDDTGRMTFYTVEGTVGFPDDFMYPGSMETSNSSRINITDAVSFIPTSNWAMKLYGAKVDLAHQSGIYGQISVGKLKSGGTISYSDLEAYITEYCNTIPVSEKSETTLFLNGNACGIDCVIATFIDDEPATVRIGTLGLGEVSLQYAFYYMGESNIIYDEAILSLIRTIKVWSNTVSLSA